MANPNEQLQRLLNDSLGPQPLRDADIERLLESEPVAEFTEAQVNRVLRNVQESIAADRTTHTSTFPRWREPSGAARSEALTVTSPAQEITMKRLASTPRRGNPRGAIACLLVSVLSLAGVLMVTSEESERQQERVAVYQAERESARQQIRREWLTAKFVPQPEVQRAAVGDTIETSSTERRRVTLPDGSALYVNASSVVELTSPRRVTLDRGEVFVEVVPQFDDAEESTPFEVVTPSRTVTAVGTKFAVDASDDVTDVLVTQGSVQVSDLDSPVVAGQLLSVRNVVESRRDSTTSLTAAPRASESLSWTRDLITATAGTLVPASRYAGGAIITVDPNGQETKLSLRKYHVDVHIEDGFARTTIDHTYFNHTSQRLEGTFHFPLPPDASLSRLAMYVNGKLMEGGMAERQHARNTFEQIVSKMKDPALLEWVDGSTFKMRVFPLEARQEKRIVLSYTQRLPSAYGKLHYRFPAGHSMDIVRDWSTAIRVKDGAAVEWHSPSHEFQTSTDDGTDDGDLLLEAVEQNSTMERDVVLALGVGESRRDSAISREASSDQTAHAARVDVARVSLADRSGLHVESRRDSTTLWTRTTHGDHQYLMLRFRPDLPATMQRPKRNWIILFEASADRDPLLARTQIEIARTLLENAEHDDTFSVITANTNAVRLHPEAKNCTATDVEFVLKQLDDTHLVGALDLEKTLAACGSCVDQSRENVLVHLGSAIPVLGEHDQSALHRLLPARSAYIGVGVGRNWSQSFMKQAASKSGGYFTQINPDEEVAWRAFELSSTLNAPRLLDVEIVSGERRDVSPPSDGEASAVKADFRRAARVNDTNRSELHFLNLADTIVHGEEVCAVARLSRDETLPDEVTVAGLLNGRPWQQTLSVQDVEDQADYLPRTWAKLEIDRLVAESATANKDRIIELSKAMYVMSPFTSLLVLENEEMYTQYNIDRGRRDHWALYPCPDEIEVVHEPFGSGSGESPELPQTETQKLLSSIQSLPQPQVVSYPNRYVILTDGAVPPMRATVSSGFIPASELEPYLYYWAAPSPSSLRFWDGNLGDDFFALNGNSNGLVDLSGNTAFGSIVVPSFRQPGVTLESELRDFDTDLDGINGFVWLDVESMTRPVDLNLSLAGSGNGAVRYVAPPLTLESLHRGGVPDRTPLFDMLSQQVPSRSFRSLETLSQLNGRVDSLQTFLLGSEPAIGQRELSRMVNDISSRIRPGGARDLTVRESEFVEWEEVDRFGATSLGRQPFDFGWRQQQLNWDDGAWKLRFGDQPVVDGFNAHLSVQQDWSRAVDALGIPQIESPRIMFGEEEEPLGRRDVRLIQLPSAQAEQQIQELLTELYDLRGLRSSAIVPEQKSVVGPVGNAHPWSVAPGQRREVGVQLPTFAAISYPEFGNDRRLFGDLMSHAPGLNTTSADVLALVAESAATRSRALARNTTPGGSASDSSDAAERAEQKAQPSRQEVPGLSPGTRNAGSIDPAARELIERARSLGWERVTLPGADGQGATTIFVDGTGRHVYERTVSEGLREHVICDGDSLLHVYADIGLAAKRQFSTFHRREIEALIPWLLPSAEELARHAQVEAIDERTVVIRPLSRTRALPWYALPGGSASGSSDAAERAEQKAQPSRQDVPGQSPGTNPQGQSPGTSVQSGERRDVSPPSLQSQPSQQTAEASSSRAARRDVSSHSDTEPDDGLRDSTLAIYLVFADDGQLAERRLIDESSGRLLLAIRYDESGTVQVRDSDGDVIASVELVREPGGAADLTPKLDDIVVLPMPIRSAEHVLENNQHDGDDFANWSEERALALVMADSAAGNGERAVKVIRERFFEQGDNRDGLYVLLSRFPGLLVKTEAVEGTDGQTREMNLLPSPEGSPLRQFVRQWIRWQQDNSDATEFAIEGPEGGFVQRLATARNLYLRWKSGQATQDRTDAQVQVELNRMLNFVGGCRTDVVGWTLLSVVEKNLAHAKFGADFAAAAERFENNPLLGWLARQERCRTLFQAGQATQARRLYSELLLQTARAGRLPRIEPEMRQLFVADSDDGQAAWSKLTTELGEILLPKRSGSAGASPSRPPVTLPRTAFLLSVQLRQLGDVEAAEELLSRILKQLDTKQRPDVALLAVEQLRQLGRSGADQVLSSVLELEPLRASSALWRYSAQVADAAGNKRLALERFEHAIQVDFRDRPDVINLESLRTDYADLLNRYDEIVKAAATLGQAPPNDLMERIVRAADQWRSIDDDDTTCCQTTARLLTKLNRDQLAWDYLTTPLAGSSGESVPWRNLAQTLTDQQQVALADIAWTRAFEFERTNPELLLSHAQMLIAAGRSEDGRRLLRLIVDGNWQPRFRSTVDHAQTLLRL